MIRKILLALTGILIICDLVIIGVSYTSGNGSSKSSKNINSIYSSNNSAISPVDVRTIVENKANGGVVTSLNFDKSKNQYDVILDTLNDSYNATVDGTTGDITSFVNTNKKPSVNLDFTPNSSNNNGANLITASKAVAAIEKAIPDGEISQLTYNIVGINPQYDSTVIKNNIKYYVDINATNGELISNYSEPLK